MFHRTGTALVILGAAIGPALHAATLDVTGGTLTYLATAGVNNALTISASGTNYVFNDITETITLSANAASAGWTGSGTNTVTGPMASVTTDFQVNLLDGADTLTLSTPITVSGNVVLFSGGSITQGASSLITAGGLAISDNNGIGTSSAELLTAVASLEAKTVNGDIFIFNTAPILDVGGVTAALSGIQVTASGNINLFSSGTIRIVTDGDTISGNGNIDIEASGDLDTGNQTLQPAIAGNGTSRTVRALATQDVNAGANGAIVSNAVLRVVAHRDVNVSSNSMLRTFGNGTLDVFARRTLTANGPIDGSIILNLTADTMTLNAAIGSAATPVLTLQPVTASRPIDIGTNTAGKLSLTQAAFNNMSATNIIIGGFGVSAATGGISFTAPIVAPPAGMTFNNAGPFTGPGSITAGNLNFGDTSTSGHTWTVGPSSVQEDSNAPIAYINTGNLGVTGGSGSDTFTVTPSPSTTITIGGGLPAPPAFPGDALHVNTSGTTVTGESVSPKSDGLLGVYTFSNRQPVGFAQIESGVAAPPSIGKSFGAAAIPLGGTTSLSFTIKNPNTLVGLTGVGFTDSLPAGLAVATPNGLAGTCGSGTITAGGSSVALSGGTLAAAGTCTFSINVLATAVGNLTNTTSAVGSSEGGAGNAATAMISVVAPDLTVTKTHSGPFIQGSAGTYTITVTNSGSAATSGTVTVVDAMPAGMTATAMGGSGWNCNAGTLTCTRNDALAARASYPPIALTVFVSADAPASLTNSVTVSGGGESNSANDSASDATAIAPGANVPALGVWMLAALAAALAAMALRKIG